jgi:hypothetical protein
MKLMSWAFYEGFIKTLCDSSDPFCEMYYAKIL